MQSSALRVLARNALLLVGALVVTCLNAQPTTRAEQPKVEVGDRWTYVTTDLLTGLKEKEKHHVVREVTQDTIVVGQGRGRHVFTRDWNELEHGEGDNVRYTRPAHIVFQFPLEVGNRWRAKFFQVTKKGKRNWQSKMWVEKIEKVTVPAGTFESFKLRVESLRDWKPGMPDVISESIWYAPETKRWVKRLYHLNQFKTNTTDMQSEELLSFTPGVASRGRAPSARIGDASGVPE